MKAIFPLFLAFLFIASFTFSCQNNSKGEEEQKSLQEILPGTWEAISFRVDIKSWQNTEQDSLFEITEEYWTEKFQVKPVQTRYKPDNTYVQEFKTLKDSIMDTNKGIWNVFGDTLMMIEPYVTYNYIVSVENGVATYTSTLDWDGDGEEDDNFVGRYRLISIAY